MTNVEKISEFLTQAKVFTFLTVDNGQPKGRPFGFHLVDGDRITSEQAPSRIASSNLAQIPMLKSWL